MKWNETANYQPKHGNDVLCWRKGRTDGLYSTGFYYDGCWFDAADESDPLDEREYPLYWAELPASPLYTA